jgi:hypothetical protein
VKAGAFILFSIASILALFVISDLIRGTSTIKGRHGYSKTVLREENPQGFAGLIFQKCFAVAGCTTLGGILWWGSGVRRRGDTVSGE